MNTGLFFLVILLETVEGSGIDVNVEPSSCQCQQNVSYYTYTCSVSMAATFSWKYGDTTLVTYSAGNTIGLVRTVGVFGLSLTSRVPVEPYIYNYTSTLKVRAVEGDIQTVNATNITCKAVGYEHIQKSVEICIFVVGPPTPTDLQLEEISSSSVMVTVSPPVSSFSMWEECGMSYAVETDGKCERLGEQEQFVCSDLKLYKEIYVFSAYGLFETTNIKINNAISQNSTNINNSGSSLLPVSNITISESLGMVSIGWKEPINSADSITKYQICINDTCYYTTDSTTRYTFCVSEFSLHDIYNISVVPCLLLPGCIEKSASEIYSYLYSKEWSWNSLTLMLTYSCSIEALIYVSLHEDNSQTVFPTNVSLWSAAGFREMYKTNLPYTQKLSYSDFPKPENVYFTVYLNECHHNLAVSLSVTNIIEIKGIQTGVNDAFLYVEENTCAVNTSDMCIALHYTTGSDNATDIQSEIQSYSAVMKQGVLKLVYLQANAEYMFCLTVLENCSIDTAVVIGWSINGTFSTQAVHQSLKLKGVVLIAAIACTIVTVIVIIFSLLLARCLRIPRQKKTQKKTEAIYEEPDSVWNIKMNDNTSYGHIHSCI